MQSFAPIQYNPRLYTNPIQSTPIQCNVLHQSNPIQCFTQSNTMLYTNPMQCFAPIWCATPNQADGLHQSNSIQCFTPIQYFTPIQCNFSHCIFSHIILLQLWIAITLWLLVLNRSSCHFTTNVNKYWARCRPTIPLPTSSLPPRWPGSPTHLHWIASVEPGCSGGCHLGGCSGQSWESGPTISRVPTPSNSRWRNYSKVTYNRIGFPLNLVRRFIQSWMCNPIHPGEILQPSF